MTASLAATNLPDAVGNQRPEGAACRALGLLRRIVVAFALILSFSGLAALAAAPAQAQAATQDRCNMSSWTWPVCEIHRPSIPRFHPQGPRPDLTPKESAWCRNNYIKASASGYVYWALTQNTKYNISFWPDYYSRYYQAMYWNGWSWAWVPVNSSYPNVPLGLRVNCDA